jgi:hypothetical protein
LLRILGPLSQVGEHVLRNGPVIRKGLQYAEVVVRCKKSSDVTFEIFSTGVFGCDLEGASDGVRALRSYRL